MVKSLAAGACALAVPFAVAAVLAAQPAPPPASPQRALLNQYCVGCHNQRAKAAGQEAARKLTLDASERADLAEFLRSLTDREFVNDSRFAAP